MNGQADIVPRQLIDHHFDVGIECAIDSQLLKQWATWLLYEMYSG